MDERSQHGHPTHPQQAASEHGLPHAPWPSPGAPQHGAPITGHAPFPGPIAAPRQLAAAPQHPSMQQFQYAATGFVLPGASQGQAVPMSAHGGMIGAPQSQPLPPAPTYQHEHLHQQQRQAAYALAPAPSPMHGGMATGGAQVMADAAPDPYAQPQAWAFPTPQGLQMVQPGAAASMVPGTLPVGARVAGTARRIRWETIVPVLAVTCLAAAIALFMHDFDRITGRDTAAAGTAQVVDGGADATDATSAAATDRGEAGTPEPGASTAATVAKATVLFRQGRFDASADLLHAILDVASPDPAAVALHDKVDAANAREDALLARLGKERAASRWSAVIATIGQVERLRPLDAKLTSLRTRARAASKAASARSVAARAAAARTAAQQRASASASGGGGGHAGGAHGTPPKAGGQPTGSAATPRPPAAGPAGAMPQRPDAPNPSPGGGANVGVVAGGAPAAGEAMCATTRTARHAGEAHAC